MKYRSISLRCAAFTLMVLSLLGPMLSPAQSSSDLSKQSEPELTRPVRPWEFLDAVGQRAAFFGKESGQMEGWIYPLKVFRNFELRFHTANGALPAHELARQLTLHAEGPSILYA